MVVIGSNLYVFELVHGPSWRELRKGWERGDVTPIRLYEVTPCLKNRHPVLFFTFNETLLEMEILSYK